VGSVARAMANMGLRDLVVVGSQAPHGEMARRMAVGAHEVLDRHRPAATLDEAVAPYARLVGTASSRARRFAAGAPVVDPRELPALLALDPPGTPTALVFGPEPSGLTDDELARTNPVVTIPCSPEQPTLNLSQAVLILAYELFRARLTERRDEAVERSADLPEPATSEERAGLLEHVRSALEAAGFARDDTFGAVMKDLERLSGRAGLSRREVTVLRGICRRVGHAVRR
jgi:TrmH family RNA methyltransferase